MQTKEFQVHKRGWYTLAIMHNTIMLNELIILENKIDFKKVTWRPSNKFSILENKVGISLISKMI